MDLSDHELGPWNGGDNRQGDISLVWGDSLISGGAKGMGAAEARLFVREGARVVVVGRNSTLRVRLACGARVKAVTVPGRRRAKGPTSQLGPILAPSMWLKARIVAPSATFTPGPKTTLGSIVTVWAVRFSSLNSPRRIEEGDAREDLPSHHRVRAHERPLLGRQRLRMREVEAEIVGRDEAVAGVDEGGRRIGGLAVEQVHYRGGADLGLGIGREAGLGHGVRQRGVADARDDERLFRRRGRRLLREGRGLCRCRHERAQRSRRGAGNPQCGGTGDLSITALDIPSGSNSLACSNSSTAASSGSSTTPSRS